MERLRRSLREAPIVNRDGYSYFVHGVTDGIPPLDPSILREIVAEIRTRIDLDRVDLLVAPEAMGIHHATALALEVDLPFVVVRKRSYDLPGEVAVHQETSYGESELYVNGVDAGDRVLIVDDVLSSGGTIGAIASALTECGAEIVDVVVVIERSDVDRPDLSVDVTGLLDVRVEDDGVVIVD